MEHFMTYDEIIAMDWEEVTQEQADEMLAHCCVGCPPARTCYEQGLFYGCYWWKAAMGDDV